MLFQLSLPGEKVSRLRTPLEQWKWCKSCTRKELELLLSHLCHIATVIRPGRNFLCNLFSLISCLSHSHAFACLNLDTRADLLWWDYLLKYWNGHSFFPPASLSIHTYSDTSGSYGCGAYHPVSASWFQIQWPDSWHATGITVKELVPIVLAAASLGPTLVGKPCLQ